MKLASGLLVGWRGLLAALGSGIVIGAALLTLGAAAIGWAFAANAAPGERRVATLGTAMRNFSAALLVAGSDFGRQVARSFALPQSANREYYVQGPEPLTYDGAAVRFAGALHRSPLVVRVPLWMARIGGLFSDQLNFNANIMHTVLSYPEEFKASETWKDLGKPETTIEQFAVRQITGSA